MLTGHQHNFEKNLLKCGWSPDASQVRSCYVVFRPINVLTCFALYSIAHHWLHSDFEKNCSPYPHPSRGRNELAGDSRQLRQDGVCVGCGFEASAVQAARALRQRQRGNFPPQPANHRLCFIRQDGEDFIIRFRPAAKKFVFGFCILIRTVACHI